MIYFVQCNGNDGPIKIGYTTNRDSFQVRMLDLSVGNPYPLRIVGTMPNGTKEEERELHRLFELDNLRGEWFECTESIKNLYSL